MLKPDLSLVATVGVPSISALTKEMLGTHNITFRAISMAEYEEERGPALSFSSAYELFEICLSNPAIMQAFWVGLAGGAGLKVINLFGKVIDASAGELGKDLYKWLKSSARCAFSSSKEANVGRRYTDSPRQRFQLVIDARENKQADNAIPIKVRMSFDHSKDGEFGVVDNGVYEDAVDDQIDTLGRIVIPYISELVVDMKRRKVAMPDYIYVQSDTDVDNPHEYIFGVLTPLETMIFRRDGIYEVRAHLVDKDERRQRRRQMRRLYHRATKERSELQSVQT